MRNQMFFANAATKRDRRRGEMARFMWSRTRTLNRSEESDIVGRGEQLKALATVAVEAPH
ncbi:hypothetical protein J6590_017790 [Homalodisca vitripennis]|nr:hypothetical protein J6590_017790 [Homalodisca vitripennis]